MNVEFVLINDHFFKILMFYFALNFYNECQFFLKFQCLYLFFLNSFLKILLDLFKRKKLYIIF